MTESGGPVKKDVPESITILQILSSEHSYESTSPILICLQGRVQKSEFYSILWYTISPTYFDLSIPPNII